MHAHVKRVASMGDYCLLYVSLPDYRFIYVLTRCSRSSVSEVQWVHHQEQRHKQATFAEAHQI